MSIHNKTINDIEYSINSREDNYFNIIDVRNNDIGPYIWVVE